MRSASSCRSCSLGSARSSRSSRKCGTNGRNDYRPPAQLDAAIIFASVGALVPLALRAVRKGGRVVCGGIHMSDIPSFGYRLLWEERQLLSVANLTRADAAAFLSFAAQVPLRVETTTYPLERANDALADLRAGRLQGAAVLVPEARARAALLRRIKPYRDQRPNNGCHRHRRQS